MTVLTDDVFKTYAGCSIVLSLLLIGLGGYTGAVRGRVKISLNAEDLPVIGPDMKASDSEHPEVQRVIRAHRNLQENALVFFAVGLLCVLSGASPMGSMIAMGVFTFARLLHPVFYLKAMQPMRTVAFGIGTLALAVMIVLVGLALARGA